jgi:hypothetical protein
VQEQLPKQDFGQVLHQLSNASLLAQPRLLAAFSIYQLCFASVAHLQLVDTQMGELQRPVQLGAFLALQQLHLENMAELLQTEWAMKVGKLGAVARLMAFTRVIARFAITSEACQHNGAVARSSPHFECTWCCEHPLPSRDHAVWCTCVQASNISDALVRPQAALQALSDSVADGADVCYDQDGNQQPAQQRAPLLPGPPVHPIQVCMVQCDSSAWRSSLCNIIMQAGGPAEHVTLVCAAEKRER